VQRKSTKSEPVRSPVRHAIHAGDIQPRHMEEPPFSHSHPHACAITWRAERGEDSSFSKGKPYWAAERRKSSSAPSISVVYSRKSI